MVALAVLVLVPVISLAWAQVLRARRAADEGPRRLQVSTDDGATLQVFRVRAPVRRFHEPVVLCHGLANNHRFFELAPHASLAHALADAGFDCYLVNLRGAEPPPWRTRPPADVTVHDHVELDVPALVQAVTRDAGAQEAFWVGHSLGGLVALAAVQGGDLALRGLVTVGSPLEFDHGPTTRALLSVGIGAAFPGRLHVDVLAALAAPLAGWFRFPLADGMVNHHNVEPDLQRRAMALVFSPVWRGVLRQLRGWERRGPLASRQGRDWVQGLASLRVPLLTVAGDADLLAPPRVLARTLARGAGPDHALVAFGTAQGHSANYGHGDLLIGRASPREVFPTIAQWLTARATVWRG